MHLGLWKWKPPGSLHAGNKTIMFRDKSGKTYRVETDGEYAMGTAFTGTLNAQERHEKNGRVEGVSVDGPGSDHESQASRES
jgi:hypothetical protein